ncbi:MAG: DUF192 domain-containing protein [Lachnospiraceae bacterium]|nr:DUF192 domain-containing protein [Lachnospiraceae bacterium]
MKYEFNKIDTIHTEKNRKTDMKKYIKAFCKGRVICENVEVADTFFKRFMGLMYRKSMDENHGLLLDPCNEIHTFGMKFSIDTITISRDNIIRYLDRDVAPRKVRPRIKDGKKVLELSSGTIEKYELELGDLIEFHE